jgi:hypothetical protein
MRSAAVQAWLPWMVLVISGSVAGVATGTDTAEPLSVGTASTAHWSTDGATSSGLPLFHLTGEPGWTNQVIARGAERERIESLPITERPYRPLHFYGNTVRRRHYRGSALPLPTDVARTSVGLVRP